MFERNGIITGGGNPLTLLGNELKIGAKLPAFVLVDNDMKEVKEAGLTTKVKLFSVVPSLDTSVCDLQTRRFETEASNMPGDVGIYTISMDLPFAQKRYCGAHEIKKLKTLSDYRFASFGEAFGVLIKETRLLARSIFIFDSSNTLKYFEIVKELSTHPNYDKALAELKKLSN